MMKRGIIIGISYVLVVLMLLTGFTSLYITSNVGVELSMLVLVLSMGFSACVLLLSLSVLQAKE